MQITTIKSLSCCETTTPSMPLLGIVVLQQLGILLLETTALRGPVWVPWTLWLGSYRSTGAQKSCPESRPCTCPPGFGRERLSHPHSFFVWTLYWYNAPETEEERYVILFIHHSCNLQWPCEDVPTRVAGFLLTCIKTDVLLLGSHRISMMFMVLGFTRGSITPTDKGTSGMKNRRHKTSVKKMSGFDHRLVHEI